MSKKITFTILSISLLTVMAGAAVAPALGTIQQYFCDSPVTLIQLIVSIPALFIIVVNLVFPIVARMLRTRTIALIGLGGYVVCGMGAFFANNIGVLLVLRALIGVSVGLLMPLSTGLLAYYNPPEKMAGLMGLSAAMNQMGGVACTLLAGLLATIGWNYAFLVYGLGLFAVILVVCYLPSEHLSSSRQETVRPLDMLKDCHSLIVEMVLCMGLFFVFVSNFAISERKTLSGMQITCLMMGVDLIALFVGLGFGRMMKCLPKVIRFLPPVAYLVAFVLLSFSHVVFVTITALILIGLANGVGIPYLNTTAGIKGGKDSVSKVMPMMSAALYFGQFASPLAIGLFSSYLSTNAMGPYEIAILFSTIYLLCVVFHSRQTRSQGLRR